MEGIGAVAVLVVTFVLWGLFHKLVFRVYFGGFSNMIGVIIGELVVCFWIATALVSLAGAGIGAFFSFAIKIVLAILKFGLIAAVIGAAVYGGYRLYQAVSHSSKHREPEKQTINNEKPLDNKQGLVCSHCGNTVKSEDEFCEICGQKLHENKKMEEDEKQIKENINICPNCGASISQEDTFCSNCGNKIER